MARGEHRSQPVDGLLACRRPAETARPSTRARVGLGLFKSSDGGAHWRSLASGPKLVDGVALDPSNPRNVLAVAAGYGVVRSTDAGRTWAGASFGAGARRVDVVAISGKTAYAGTYGRGLFGSSDGGRSWRELGRSRRQAR